MADDEFLIALDLAALLSEAGAAVVGPATSLIESLRLASREELSAAVLDIRLGSDTTEPIARVLADRCVPFLFYTGQEPTEAMLAAWPDCRVISKPAPQGRLVDAVAALVAGSATDGGRQRLEVGLSAGRFPPPA